MMKRVLLFSALLCVVLSAVNIPPLNFASQARRQKTLFQLFQAKSYNVSYFTQKVDNFDYSNNLTYKMRYLEDKSVWRGNGQPIFFYCGNEAEVTLFYENSGFLTTTLRDQFNALILFAEHRYFGESQPFGNNSYKNENLKFLTVEQTLADYVAFLKWYKKANNCPDSPIYAFGGSYGGMLAAYMRMKFPNIVDGAISSSGPILYFKDQTNLTAFNQIVTYNYQKSTVPNCASSIKAGLDRLQKYIDRNDTARETLRNISRSFRLCANASLNSSSDLNTLQDWIITAYTYMAMTNYPYETSFLRKMPGWPANDSACQPFKDLLDPNNTTDELLFAKMYESVKTYYNYDNQISCHDIFHASIADADMSGWNILACNSMAMPMETDGVHDIFVKRPWNETSYTAFCQSTYNQTPRYTWASDFFVDRNNNQLRQYSKIFFANGDLDPWSAGGVTTTVSRDVIAYVMKDSAHHLDLRLPNKLDPEGVVQGRNLEILTLRGWIFERNRFAGKTQTQ